MPVTAETYERQLSACNKPISNICDRIRDAVSECITVQGFDADKFIIDRMVSPEQVLHGIIRNEYEALMYHRPCHAGVKVKMELAEKYGYSLRYIEDIIWEPRNNH